MQYEEELGCARQELQLLRSRNVALENALADVEDGIVLAAVAPSHAELVQRLRTKVADLEQQRVELQDDVLRLRALTCKSELYKQCVEKQSARLRAVLK